ncbi:MAG TPA: MFS transporter [Pyrinomonadaceae bacterium]|nr:MFS transporter [Pyrinomonadaceae bacterium]
MTQDPRTETENAESEKFLTKPILIIFLTVVIDLIGFGIVIPVLPYYVDGDLFKGTPIDYGLIVASYSIMQFFFAPIFGAVSDRYGRRMILFVSLLGTALGFVVVGLATALWMVYAGRILDGITGGNISTAQAYIADVTSRENRARGMGLIGAAFGIGFVLGPALGGILSTFGPHVPFLFAAGMALVNAIAVYFFLPESLDVAKARSQPREINRFAVIFHSLKDISFRGITIIYFLITVGFTVMTTAFVLYTQERFGYDAHANGWLFLFIGALAVGLQGGIFARLAKRFGEPNLAVAGTVLLTVSLFAVPFVGPASGGLIGLLVGITFFSIGNSIASPALTSLASKNAPEHEQGKALGIMQSGASLARAIAPMAAGFLLNNAIGEVDDPTIQRTFWVASAIMLCAFLAAIYYLKRKADEVLA